MIFMGIDPGKSGSVAVILNDGAVAGTCLLSASLTDLSEFLKQFDLEQAQARIEKVHSSPQMGVKSAFTFGESYGAITGLVVGLGIALDVVRPQEWQKVIGCLSGGDKNVTKARAQALFPRTKITHKNADALLIAEYCRRQYRGGQP